MILIMRCGMPYALRICQRLSLWMLSNAFSWSMKFTYNSLFQSVHCLSMFRSVKMLSVHPRPLRNPDCSFRSRSSTAWVMRCIVTLQKLLLGTDKRVIPRQLLQSLRDPFFGILIITPLLQSVGISSSSQIFVNKVVRMVAASSGSALNSSAFRLSWPGAFPFVIY